MSITIVRTDGTEAECVYWLNPAEKAMLREKINAYCKDQTGRSLEQYRRRYQKERIAAGQGKDRRQKHEKKRRDTAR